MTDFRRDLPDNEYQALINASSPSSTNVFTTVGDIPAAVGFNPYDRFYKSLIEGASKIVFIGTSITEGSGAEMEGNNIWVEEYMRKIRARFPSVTFTHENLGLAGKRSYNFPNQSFVAAGADDGDNAFYKAGGGTYNWTITPTIGKSWIDHAEDETPDLILIEFGANDFESPPTFKQHIIDGIDIIRTWSKIPSIVLCTPSLSSITNTDEFKAGKIKGFAEVMRDISKENNTGLLDVNREWMLLIEGVDPLIKSEERLSLDKLTDTGGTPATTLTYNTIGLNPGTCQYSTVDLPEWRDMTLTCNYTPRSGSSNMIFGLRQYIGDTYDSGLKLEMAKGFTRITEGGVLKKTTAYSMPNNIAYAMVLTVTRDKITLTVDGTPRFDYDIAVIFSAGRFTFDLTDLDVAAVNLKLTRLPLVQTKKYTNNELLGSLTTTDWNNGDFREGGDSIIHPSRIGLREGFYPVIDKHIAEL